MVLKGVLLVATTRGVLRNFTKSTGKTPVPKPLF